MGESFVLRRLCSCSKIFEMSIQRDPFNWSGALYEKYCSEISAYIQGSVLPSLNEKRQLNSITFLREWPLRFDNHRLVEKGLADMFTYLVLCTMPVEIRSGRRAILLMNSPICICRPTHSFLSISLMFVFDLTAGSILHTRKYRNMSTITIERYRRHYHLFLVLEHAFEWLLNFFGQPGCCIKSWFMMNSRSPHAMPSSASFGANARASHKTDCFSRTLCRLTAEVQDSFHDCMSD